MLLGGFGRTWLSSWQFLGLRRCLLGRTRPKLYAQPMGVMRKRHVVVDFSEVLNSSMIIARHGARWC